MRSTIRVLFIAFLALLIMVSTTILFYRISIVLDERKEALPELWSYELEIIAYKIKLAWRGDSKNFSHKERLSAVMSYIYKYCELEYLGRYEEALTTYDELLKHFGEDDSPEIRADLAGTMWRKVWLLEYMGRYEDGLKVCDEAVAGFGADDALEIKYHVNEILLLKAELLQALNKPEKQVSTCNEILTRYDFKEETHVGSQYIQVLTIKAAGLEKLFKQEEAIQVCEEASRFGRENLRNINPSFYIENVNLKASILEKYDKYEDAIKAHEELIDLYKEGPLEKKLADALAKKARCMVELAKEKESREETLALLKEACRVCEASTELDERNATAWKIWAKALIARYILISCWLDRGNNINPETKSMLIQEMREPLLKKAIHNCRKSILLNDDCAETWYMWGDALMNQFPYAGDREKEQRLLEQSCKMFEIALDLDPKHFNAKGSWAFCLIWLISMEQNPEKKKTLEEKLIEVWDPDKYGSPINLFGGYL